MYYTIYRTTNLINGKFYVGMHQTNNLEDNYLGSGKLLRYAIMKYGINSFRKEILHVFDSREAMLTKEAEIVDEAFLQRDDTYNLVSGGKGGFDYINKSGIVKFKKPHTEETKKKLSAASLGKVHSAETRRKISEKSRLNNTAKFLAPSRKNPKSQSHKKAISEALKLRHKENPGDLIKARENMAKVRAMRKYGDNWKANLSKASKSAWAEGGSRYQERVVLDFVGIKNDLKSGLKPKDIRAIYKITKAQYDHAKKAGYI